MSFRKVERKHQLAIARRTVNMTDAGALIMGGMTVEEAQEFLAEHGNAAERKRYGRRDHG